MYNYADLVAYGTVGAVTLLVVIGEISQCMCVFNFMQLICLGAQARYTVVCLCLCV